jgi:putative endonuclease
MFFAYVLKSNEHDYFYKGHCQNLEKRLNQHNSGKTKSIKPYIPFSIVYTEEFQTEFEAIEREKYFKTAAGRRFLKKNYSCSTMSARLNAVRTGIV